MIQRVNKKIGHKSIACIGAKLYNLPKKNLKGTKYIKAFKNNAACKTSTKKNSCNKSHQETLLDFLGL